MEVETNAIHPKEAISIDVRGSSILSSTISLCDVHNVHIKSLEEKEENRDSFFVVVTTPQTKKCEYGRFFTF